jgi:RNA polymerase sigma-70 factor (ECF subfamily)
VKSDSDLIAGFLAGDREAFDELVKRHREQVFATAWRMVGNAETAEEIAQETFVRVFKGLRRFRREAKFTTWLYRITMNLCYDEMKRRTEETLLDPEMGDANAVSPDRSMADKERATWIKHQIETLPFKQRSTVTLRIFRGMSFKEIGRTIGCSSGAARVNYRHALLKLKEAAARTGGLL